MDISCAVCTEPWDSYGARHGDMVPWEYSLFQRGAGCPCCEGDTPEGIDADEAAEEHIRDAWLRGATDDPDSFTLGFDLGASALPKIAWEAPPPTILWSCATCKVSAGYEPDGDDHAELVWLDGDRAHYRYGFGYTYGGLYGSEDPTEEPEYKLGEDVYCPGCAAICQGYDDGPEGCDAVILLLEDVDTYSPGSRFPDVLAGSPFSAGHGYCSDCFERIPSCHYCGKYWDDHGDAHLCCAPECSADGCWTKIDPDAEDAADHGDGDGLCADCRKEASDG